MTTYLSERGADFLGEAAMLRLGKELFEKMEHLDPTGREWNSLNDFEKDYYATCAETVVASFISDVRRQSHK